MTELKRNLFSQLKDYLKYFPVVAIIGARQVGKTELAKSLGPKWSYFDLENPLDFDRISRDPVFFFKEHPDYLILDEAQEYPELFRVLRGVVDEKRQVKGRFLLTGSSSPHLFSKLSESLAGRMGILELGTLKANEFYQKPLSDFYQIFSQKKVERDFLSQLKPQLGHEELKNFWLRGGYS
ncbi:MAG: AAA family ATPase [Deltaproteobacteria bacterium]|nr:AAA family ATPase [Deltaproteobacteria bacterium]